MVGKHNTCARNPGTCPERAMTSRSRPVHTTATPSRRWPWFTLSLAVCAILIHLFGWSALLEFDRRLISQQPWRLFTGHLTHFPGDHLGWDVALWVAFGCWAERLRPAVFRAATLAAAGLISLSVLLFQPQFDIYRGLSGLDSTAFAFVVTHLALHARETGNRRLMLVSAAALGGFVTKCAYEIATAGTVFVSGDGFEPVPLAHLVGAACGIGFNYAEQRRTQRRLIARERAKSGTAAPSV